MERRVEKDSQSHKTDSLSGAREARNSYLRHPESQE